MKKLIRATLLLCCLLLMTGCTTRETKTEHSYVIDEKTGTVTAYHGDPNTQAYNGSYPETITIPSKIRGTTITVIGSYCFDPENVPLVPELDATSTPRPSLTPRGSTAAPAMTAAPTATNAAEQMRKSLRSRLCHLRKIIIPQGVKEIQAYAFSNSCLTDITVPSSVTVIDEKAFAVMEDGAETKNPDLTVHVKKGSKAEELLKNNAYVANLVAE